MNALDVATKIIWATKAMACAMAFAQSTDYLATPNRQEPFCRPNVFVLAFTAWHFDHPGKNFRAR